MEYDNYGNITKKNGKAYTYGNATWKDLLTGFDGKAIEYDAQGNPVKYLGHTLTWEKGRQLKKFDNIEYTYNANGIRTSKKVNGVLHTYTLDGTKILRETWGGNALVPLYDNEDSVCGILYNNVPYYFIKNLQGDIIAIVDKDAKTVARYSYDAWGVPEVKFDSSECQIATINPFRYRGYYYDEEIRLYYLMARYYSSRIGRFINGDLPEWIGTNSVHICNNLFAYCKNDCVNDEDETGHGGIESLISALNSALDILKNILDMIRNSYYKERVQLENSVKLLTKKQRNHLADIKSLNTDVKRIKKYLGWVGNALLFATFAVILGTAYSTGASIDRAILDCGVEYLISTIVEGAGKLFQKVAKYIPYIGFLIGLIGGWLLSYGLSKLFNSKKAQRVKNRFASLIKNVRTTFWNWLVNGIKSLSA